MSKILSSSHRVRWKYSTKGIFLFFFLFTSAVLVKSTTIATVNNWNMHTICADIHRLDFKLNRNNEKTNNILVCHYYIRRKKLPLSGLSQTLLTAFLGLGISLKKRELFSFADNAIKGEKTVQSTIRYNNNNYMLCNCFASLAPVRLYLSSDMIIFLI